MVDLNLGRSTPPSTTPPAMTLGENAPASGSPVPPSAQRHIGHSPGVEDPTSEHPLEGEAVTLIRTLEQLLLQLQMLRDSQERLMSVLESTQPAMVDVSLHFP